MKHIILLTLLALLVSCGGPKNLTKKDEPKKKAELDALFGISDSSADGDDELLTLLENENKPKKQKAVETKTEPKVEKTEPVVDDSRIKNLENQIAQKDQIISDLRNENNRLARENTDLMNRKPETVYKENSSNSNVTISDDFKEAYSNGIQLFNSRQYNDALATFQQLMAQNPNHKLVDNAQYWEGECQYALKNFQEAILSFEAVLSLQKSNKKGDAQFKLGLTYYLMKDYDNSRSELQRFIDKYPSNRNIDRANKYLTSF